VSRHLLVLAAALGLAVASPVRADGPVLRYRVAKLQGLDKITARTTVIEARVGEEAAFGTLRITPRACLETPPTEPPESAAFLEIKVDDPGSEPKDAFSGWMFASSPSISALEHPVYDVWVIECAEPVEPEPLPPSPSSPSTEGQNG
jgi:hypothetical protein